MYHLEQYVTLLWYALTQDEALFCNKAFASRSIFLQAFPVLVPAFLLVNANHGRFSTKDSKFNLPGMILDNAISNNPLGKFAWVSMEIISPIMFIVDYFSQTPHLSNTGNMLIGLAFLVHYTHRSLVAPLFRAESLKPIHLYVWLGAMTFNFHNGSTIGWWLSSLGRADGYFIPGLLLWTLGFAGNTYHDEILFSLRKTGGKKDYSIPYGGLYQYISCPNYFCEIVEWIGLGIAAGRQCSPIWVFVVALLAVLVPRARANHQWFKRTFKDYPQRNALIPFVW
ncbi:hypothetical protein NEOLI_002027 [Neolecta irregularis DAH-3]|uniref:3-oxo-5-alpha-steroid 4-dehydrogenase C-terminal domain-containing protein n=1 Tax=Neolecta irregularis (strain DAH-3) TaxID=1198029 RepID=A0A1U7LTF2_NEOID|nr:hypothetical protein NEOLI_002027 [Neolecta irregularis DAH-3]|eukprot:OLL25909.1 hypothetical protein NEOLI_002027 [Neolecta irregularis DAH-3]